MPSADCDALAGLRRLRGVSWRWRDDVPVQLDLAPGAVESGVIAQDVRDAFPDLVSVGPSGHLMVDYGGLALRIGGAVAALAVRVGSLDATQAPSDSRLKSDVDSLAAALDRLRSDEELTAGDAQALVGLLVEAVKELDRRVERLERLATAD